MDNDLTIGYLVLEVSDLDAWRSFLGDVMGLQVGPPSADGSVPVAMDRLAYRLMLTPGPADDIVAFGFLAHDENAYLRAVARLHQADIFAATAPASLCESRHVESLTVFQDADGTAVELGWGMSTSEQPPISPLVPGGFVTGEMGFGHFLAWADDLKTTLAFYERALGARLSDTAAQDIGDGLTIEAAFLHINARHHSLAFGRPPAAMPKRLHHLMVQTVNWDNVGLALDRALDAGVEIVQGLGRHPNDRMFSFYARTPSGFLMEFGAGAVDVTEDWTVEHHVGFSAWGHRPLLAAAVAW